MKSDALASLAERRRAGVPFGPVTPAQSAALRDCLRHCDEDTREAALRYWSSGDKTALRLLVVGIVASASDREVRGLGTAELDRLSLTLDLAVDSLSLMEIGLLLEDVLQISVNNNELLEMRTFGETFEFLHARVSSLSERSQPSTTCAQAAVQPGASRRLEGSRGNMFEATAKVS